jgi:uncharacterized damage-inducible protein DinB
MHKADCEIFAEYNSSMNKSVYTAAANLDNSALHLDRGAFFGSIIGTLNHILVADTIWLKRFAQHPAQFKSLAPVQDLPSPKALNEIIHADMPLLWYQRRALDKTILMFVRELTDEMLATKLNYNNLKGEANSKSFGHLLLHFFNHQTHHRGQITTLFTQLGIGVGVTDLFVCIPSD